jgi:hypothetical protein
VSIMKGKEAKTDSLKDTGGEGVIPDFSSWQ